MATTNKGREKRKGKPKELQILSLWDMIDYYHKNRSHCEKLLKDCEQLVFTLRSNLNWECQGDQTTIDEAKRNHQLKSLGPGKVYLKDIALWILENLEAQITILESSLTPLDTNTPNFPNLLKELQKEIASNPQWSKNIALYAQRQPNKEIRLLDALKSLKDITPKLKFLREEISERNDTYISSAIDFCSSHHACVHLKNCTEYILSQKKEKLEMLKAKLVAYKSPLNKLYKIYCEKKDPKRDKSKIK